MEWFWDGLLCLFWLIVVGLGSLAWFAILRWVANSVLICFYREGVARIVDFELTLSNPEKDSTLYEKPILVLTLDCIHGTRHFRFKTDQLEHENVLVAMSLPENLPVAWNDSDQWRMLLLGSSMRVACHWNRPHAVPLSKRANNRKFISWCMVVTLAQSIVITGMYFG